MNFHHASKNRSVNRAKLNASHLVFLLHLLHLPELLRGQHALYPLHVPHEEALRLEELVVGSLPRLFELVVLLPLQLQFMTH